MPPSVTTVSAYLDSLPPDRRAAIQAVRKAIRKNLPRGFEEGIQYGMLGYFIPLSRYPDTYNGQALSIAALGSKKGYMTVHLMAVYGDEATRRWFVDAYARAGKKLDMGKACVRFKKVDDLALEVIGQVIARVSVEGFIAAYEASRRPSGRRAAKSPKRAARPPRA